MNYTAIVRMLSVLGLVMAVCLLITGAVAVAYEEWIQLGAIAIAFLIVGVISASLLFLTSKPTRRDRLRDGLAVLVLWWLLASVAGAIPFIFNAAPGEVIRTLHESVSALTTTGHTALEMPDGTEWPVSLIVWRGMLHIQGALASLIAATSIFAALNLGGPGIHRTVLFTLPEGSFFSALPRVLIAAAIAIFGLIAIVFLALFISGIPFGRALADAVSVATTGLVEPGRADMAPRSAVHGLVLGAGLLVSTIGLAVALEAMAGRWRRVLFDPEVVVFVGVCVVTSALAVIAGIGWLQAAGWSLSQISTSGLPLSDVGAESVLPVTVLILPALIGGSAVSTAGGIKLARLALLTGRAGEEFSRLGYRDSVVVMRFRGREQPDSAIVGIWVYLVAYIACVSLSMVGLSLSGVPFETAVKSAAGALSNAGNLVDLAGANRPNLAASVSMIAMLLGRLEVIALIPALSAGFWRS